MAVSFERINHASCFIKWGNFLTVCVVIRVPRRNVLSKMCKLVQVQVSTLSNLSIDLSHLSQTLDNRSCESVSKLQWPTVTWCLCSLLRVYQSILLWCPWIYTLTAWAWDHWNYCLIIRWKLYSSGTFFRTHCGIVRHTQAGLGIIISWRDCRFRSK